MASIPLPALDIKTQQTSPLATYAQAQQIVGGQQDQQIKAVQLQQAKQAQDDQQAMTKAMQSWDGQDYTKLPSLILKNGGSANAVFAATQHINDVKAKVSEIAKNDAATGASNLETSIKNNDQYRGRLQSIIQAPADQKQDLWDKEITTEEQTGKVQAGQISHTYPGDDKATEFANHFALGSVLAKEANEAAQTANKKKELELEQKKFANTQPGGAQENPEQKFLRLKSAADQGQRLEPADKSFLDAYKQNKTMVPQFNFNLSGGAGGGLTPAALDQQAENYWNTGKLPPGGRGPAGLAQNRAIMNRAAELHSGESLAEGSAEYKANAESLKKLQSSFDQVSAFENTANKNLDLFTSLAKKAIDSGIPLANAPLRTGATLLGSEDQAAINAARQVAVNEIAKVTSNPGLSGQLSDSARHEIEAFNPANATYGQTMRVAQVLKTDMGNRHQSYADQISEIKGRMRVGAKTTQPAAPAAATPPANGLQVGQTVSIKGKQMKVKAVHPDGSFDAE